MATSISAILIPCLKSFNQLQERVEQPDYGYEREVSSTAWGDELGRLRIWAANIGAHQTGQSSLDFRLRDASHISNQVTKLLRELNHSLDDIVDELLEDGITASEDDQTSASWLDDSSTTELQQLHEEVANIIDCLYQLSMLIRKPAQHDLLVGSRIGDKAEFEFYDKEHVRNLYPGTEEQISQRLGRAITRRRKYLNYRERHHRKLEKGIEEAQGIQGIGSVMSETIITDFKTHNIEFEETSSNSGMSQTSYAPSLIDGGRITIPPPPRELSGGKPFECPYCFFVIDVKSTRSWSRHIFKDIKPYICTSTECSMPDRLYDSRREWYFHETTEHHREDFVCALCKDTLQSSKQYERHVARHLEELALFALPRNEMDDAEDDEDNVVDARASTSENGVTVDTTHSSDHSDHSSLASVTDDEDSTGTDVQVRPRSAVEGHENFDPVVYPVEIGPSEASTARHGSMLPGQNRPPQPQKPIDVAITNAFDRAGVETVTPELAPAELIDQITQNVIKQLQTVGGPDRPTRVPPRNPYTPASIRRTSSEQRSFAEAPRPEEEHRTSFSRPISPEPGADGSPNVTSTRQTVYYQHRSHSAAAATAAARRPAPINSRDRVHGSRIPSPDYDYELERKTKRLEELEKKVKEDVARDEYEKFLQKEAIRAKKKKEEEELEKSAIEEYHIKQLVEKAKKENKKEEVDEELRERVKKTLDQAGHDEESIEKILKKGEKGKEHGHEDRKDVKIDDLTRLIYMKVHRQHLSPETSDLYELP